MCTAVTYQTRDFYFGRTLDYEHSFGQEITVTPRNFPFRFRHADEMPRHHALIGMASVMDGCPLYFEAANERGLCIAGLNFVGNARYFDPMPGKINLAQFEFVPYLLGRCSSVDEAMPILQNLNITNDAFRPDLPPSQLHWIVSDRSRSLTVESMADGLHIHDNPVGVLTNNPPFEFQMFALNHYHHLTPHPPAARFAPGMHLYSRGMGAIGLPGDLSSQSRFVRAAFVKMHSVSDDSEESSVSQFFHILASVNVPRGSVRLPDGSNDITVYSSCINACRGIYYYTAYDNHRITAVDMHRENLDKKELIRYPQISSEQIFRQNG